MDRVTGQDKSALISVWSSAVSFDIWEQNIGRTYILRKPELRRLVEIHDDLHRFRLFSRQLHEWLNDPRVEPDSEAVRSQGDLTEELGVQLKQRLDDFLEVYGRKDVLRGNGNEKETTA